LKDGARFSPNPYALERARDRPRFSGPRATPIGSAPIFLATAPEIREPRQNPGKILAELASAPVDPLHLRPLPAGNVFPR
jgi:hypothetical protein